MGDHGYECGDVESVGRRHETDLEDIEELLEKIICLLRRILNAVDEPPRKKC